MGLCRIRISIIASTGTSVDIQLLQFTSHNSCCIIYSFDTSLEDEVRMMTGSLSESLWACREALVAAAALAAIISTVAGEYRLVPGATEGDEDEAIAAGTSCWEVNETEDEDLDKVAELWFPKFSSEMMDFGDVGLNWSGR